MNRKDCSNRCVVQILLEWSLLFSRPFPGLLCLLCEYWWWDGTSSWADLRLRAKSSRWGTTSTCGFARRSCVRRSWGQISEAADTTETGQWFFEAFPSRIFCTACMCWKCCCCWRTFSLQIVITFHHHPETLRRMASPQCSWWDMEDLQVSFGPSFVFYFVSLILIVCFLSKCSSCSGLHLGVCFNRIIPLTPYVLVITWPILLFSWILLVMRWGLPS